MLLSGSPTALLDDRGVKRADALAAQAGVSIETLVAHAGARVAEVAATGLQDGARIAVWAGPGMNGADARKAAELLSERFAVIVYAYGVTASEGAHLPLQSFGGEPCDLVIDGLFGTGLRRPWTRSAAKPFGVLQKADRLFFRSTFQAASMRERGRSSARPSRLVGPSPSKGGASVTS